MDEDDAFTPWCENCQAIRETALVLCEVCGRPVLPWRVIRKRGKRGIANIEAFEAAKAIAGKPDKDKKPVSEKTEKTEKERRLEQRLARTADQAARREKRKQAFIEGRRKKPKPEVRLGQPQREEPLEQRPVRSVRLPKPRVERAGNEMSRAVCPSGFVAEGLTRREVHLAMRQHSIGCPQCR